MLRLRISHRLTVSIEKIKIEYIGDLEEHDINFEVRDEDKLGAGKFLGHIQLSGENLREIMGRDQSLELMKKVDSKI